MMKSLRLIVAFAILAFSIVVCLWGAGVIPYEEANETLRRVLLIVGTVGIASTLVFFLMSPGKPAPKESVETSNKVNNGPKF